MFEQNKSNGRYILCSSAWMSRLDGASMQEWMDNDEVQKICEEYDLEPSILEHIAWWIWKNPK